MKKSSFSSVITSSCARGGSAPSSAFSAARRAKRRTKPRAGDDHSGLVRHRGFFLDDDLVKGIHQFGAARVGVLFADLLQFLFDDVHQLFLAGEYAFEIGDALLDLRVLLAQRENLQIRQALQAHIEDGLRLYLREAEALHQFIARFAGGLAAADEADDLVEVIHGDDQPFEYVGARLGLFQFVAGAAGDDVFLMADVVADERLEAELHGLAVGDGHHVDAHRHLQVGIFIKDVEHLVGIDVAL